LGTTTVMIKVMKRSMPTVRADQLRWPKSVGEGGYHFSSVKKKTLGRLEITLSTIAKGVGNHFSKRGELRVRFTRRGRQS